MPDINIWTKNKTLEQLKILLFDKINIHNSRFDRDELSELSEKKVSPLPVHDREVPEKQDFVEPKELASRVGLGDHGVADVGPVETGDEKAGVGEL